MKHCLFSRLGLGIAIAATAAAATGPAQAATTSGQTTTCTAPALSQPFLAWGDTNYYALVGGQTSDNFNGDGWVLSGGARIVTATLQDGTTGSVLELPAGSSAVSPTVCLQSDYPSARLMVDNLTGSNGGSVAFSVSYAGTSSAGSPLQTGSFKTAGNTGVNGGWELSDPQALDPSSAPGWQLMRITLTPQGPKKGDFQVYDLYADPQMRG